MQLISFNQVWRQALNDVLTRGQRVYPRGLETRELQHYAVEIDMRAPVLTLPERQLSYIFMAAEAYWILSGDNRVETIAAYNKNIAKFSDDGLTFFGAYGPRIASQLDYVVAKLIADPDTRQAGLTIWRESPPATKDTPCTVAIWCQLRGGRLQLHVFMRSSDLWLGLPYDVFNFSMLGCLLSARLKVLPGQLYLTAASSHLYSSNFKAALDCVDADHPELNQPCLVPSEMYMDEMVLMSTLDKLRTSHRGDELRWWEVRP